MKRLAHFLTLAVLASSPLMASERAEIGWQWIDQGAMIVDVRTAQEFMAGHLPKAVNFPLSELQRHFANMNKDTQIVLYCRSGNRSGQAYQYLKYQGFTQIHNAGGLVEMQTSK